MGLALPSIDSRTSYRPPSIQMGCPSPGDFATTFPGITLLSIDRSIDVRVCTLPRPPVDHCSGAGPQLNIQRMPCSTMPGAASGTKWLGVIIPALP